MCYEPSAYCCHALFKNEPRLVISNNVVFLTSLDSDKPVQPILSLDTPNDVQPVA